MASKIRNICSGKPYGNEGKKRWTQVGILIEKEGRFYIKLDHLPLFTDDAEGIFLSCFDQDHRSKSRDPQPADFDENEDVPF